MAYQVSGVKKIKDDNTVTFKNVTVKNYYTLPSPYTFQGSTSGYRSGGGYPPFTTTNTIDKFPFSSDTNASDVGDLTVARNDCAGSSSNSHGYVATGQLGVPGTSTQYNTIDKFPFSSDANATDVGDATQTRRASSGHSMSTHGYASGGRINPSPHNNTTIDKYPFSSDANATDVGDLTQGRDRTGGQSSTTHGYTSGGGTEPPFTPVNTIDKFSFSSDANATDVGDLPAGQEGGGGTSSTASGYIAGGWGPGTMNNIQKFSFSSDGNGSDVGDLSVARSNSQSGSSSTTHGYTNGGTSSNVIDKYPFSSDANATDVGDLTNSTSFAATGQQI